MISQYDIPNNNGFILTSLANIDTTKKKVQRIFKIPTLQIPEKIISTLDLDFLQVQKGIGPGAGGMIVVCQNAELFEMLYGLSLSLNLFVFYVT